MRELYLKNKLFFTLLIIAFVIFLCWYFSSIFISIVIAGVISIIGFPLVDRLDRLHIGRIRLPHILNVLVTLILIIVVAAALFAFFIPLIIKEATLISSMDIPKLTIYYNQSIQWVQNNLITLGLISKDTTIEALIRENISRVVNFSMFSNIIALAINFAGIFFFYLFAVLFLSFFFLYDHTLLPGVIMLFVPAESEEKVRNVMSKSKILLSRYFIGLTINVLVMIASYAIVLSILGVPGALVIAFVAGILNIIPYIGPLSAVLIGMIVGVTGVISVGAYDMVLTVAMKALIGMVAVIVVDNIVYGPLIQGKSVKAHPVEIFLVILAAGSLGGIPAMIVAVPSYAFIRILAGEFLQQFKIGRKIAETNEGEIKKKTKDDIESSGIKVS